jgi:hypothetical protein
MLRVVRSWSIVLQLLDSRGGMWREHVPAITETCKLDSSYWIRIIGRGRSWRRASSYGMHSASNGTGCGGCRRTPHAHKIARRSQVDDRGLFRARIRSRECDSYAYGECHQKSRPSAKHPPASTSVCLQPSQQSNTYVAQVLHDVEKLISLLAAVAHAVNGLPTHQVFGDLCPHVLPGLHCT